MVSPILLVMKLNFKRGSLIYMVSHSQQVAELGFQQRPSLSEISACNHLASY